MANEENLIELDQEHKTAPGGFGIHDKDVIDVPEKEDPVEEEMRELWAKDVFEVSQNSPDIKILDAGAGNAVETIRRIKKLVALAPSKPIKVYLIDIDKSSLDEARAKIKDVSFPEHVQLFPIQGDVNNPTGIWSNTIDGVIATEFIHWLDDKQRANVMAEMARVLKPGGVIGTSVVSLFSSGNLISEDVPEKNSEERLKVILEKSNNGMADVTFPLFRTRYRDESKGEKGKFMYYYTEPALRTQFTSAGLEPETIKWVRNNYYPNGLNDERYKDNLTAIARKPVTSKAVQ